MRRGSLAPAAAPFPLFLSLSVSFSLHLFSLTYGVQVSTCHLQLLHGTLPGPHPGMLTCVVCILQHRRRYSRQCKSRGSSSDRAEQAEGPPATLNRLKQQCSRGAKSRALPELYPGVLPVLLASCNRTAGGENQGLSQDKSQGCCPVLLASCGSKQQYSKGAKSGALPEPLPGVMPCVVDFLRLKQQCSRHSLHRGSSSDRAAKAKDPPATLNRLKATVQQGCKAPALPEPHPRLLPLLRLTPLCTPSALANGLRLLHHCYVHHPSHLCVHALCPPPHYCSPTSCCSSTFPPLVNVPSSTPP